MPPRSLGMSGECTHYTHTDQEMVEGSEECECGRIVNKAWRLRREKEIQLLCKNEPESVIETTKAANLEYLSNDLKKRFTIDLNTRLDEVKWITN